MTTHLQSEQLEAGLEAGPEARLSRRGLVQALAAGAAASAVTPALAEPTAVVAEATSADYTRDPTRWGSAEVATLFPGFKHLDMRTKGAIIRVRHGGSGPPLLLLHGYPNNHVLWYAVAARLAQRYHVVLADLRGYGDAHRCPSRSPISSTTASASWPRTRSRSWRTSATSVSSWSATTAAPA